MILKKTLFVITLFILSCFSNSYAQSSSGMSYSRTQIISGFRSPESVVSDGRFLYVSNVGSELKPQAKDGDGFISKVSLKGDVIDAQFIGELNAPKGMAISTGTLYVTDIDRIVAYDINKGKKKFEISFEKENTYFLNDIVAKDKTTLYVSATDINQIFEVKIIGKQPTYQALDLGGKVIAPNGLAYNAKEKKLYVATYGTNEPNGEIGVLELGKKKPTYKRLTETKGAYDGIFVTLEGDIIVSDWGASLQQGGSLKTIKKKKAVDIDGLTQLSGPADFLFDVRKNQIIVPEMVTGNVLIFGKNTNWGKKKK